MLPVCPHLLCSLFFPNFVSAAACVTFLARVFTAQSAQMLTYVPTVNRLAFREICIHQKGDMICRIYWSRLAGFRLSFHYPTDWHLRKIPFPLGTTQVGMPIISSSNSILMIIPGPERQSTCYSLVEGTGRCKRWLLRGCFAGRGKDSRRNRVYHYTTQFARQPSNCM